MHTDKATRLQLLDLSLIQTRVFHLTWMAFFVCFFAWFACAPLMPVIRGEFDLTTKQIANINIAAVAITILVRLIIGPLCDRFGPRKTYTGLLLLGAIPVFGVASAQSYESFLFFRLLIGAVGASFVITQYHTSVMYAANVVGTANATAAGWGNAGGGAAQAIMPLVLGAVIMLGAGEALGWRVALLVPGVLMLVMAFLYWRYTQDCMAGNFSELHAAGALPGMDKKGGWKSFKRAAGNYRVWLLFITYGACFGVEIFMHNVVAIYFLDNFDMSLKAAGLVAGSFGLLALFARALGGWVSDQVARRGGLDARTKVLFVLMVGEGLGLLVFSVMDSFHLAVLAMLAFGLFTHMACGATYALVPFIDREALGGVAGIVGAGGNVGAVAAGFVLLWVGEVQQTLFILGSVVLISALCAIAVRFSAAHKVREEALLQDALAQRSALAADNSAEYQA
ncbi:MFS transporter [Halopseudomonas bauzanensis]|uniref:MFS transporter, NNP family, nitrate/nitrite transporter n=1 Tax=Halopseudomonas bauzanensis TaxID=653930 RepID=A0A1H9VTQ2_9GAMM|nr:MFS transporter [Halopseudomonas bauzanensis]SES25200.1 MFS transporter, NNP family, nitrate/nitrite transporter [Halopseudomonas bauzanensis]SFM25366.1 MFS transporter, NNP family, nitrate/nitrite transporter [Halopseudomonas bauzanensis]